MGILKAYIREGEHQQQDFKFRVDDAKKIARTLAAFANTDGGRLLIGVKDNGKVTGVFPEEELYIVQGAADMYCKPSLTIYSEVVQEEHKLVLIITVKKSEKRPIRALDEADRWKAYVRRDDHTLLASKILLGVWKQENKKTVSPQTFDKDEQLILDTIRKFNGATLSKIYRETKLNKNYIDKLLVLFVTWNLVEIDPTPKGTFFYISNPVATEDEETQ